MEHAAVPGCAQRLGDRIQAMNTPDGGMTPAVHGTGEISQRREQLANASRAVSVALRDQDGGAR
jgi:hypothetical protein